MIEDLANELVDELIEQGEDDLATRLILLFGDFDYSLNIPAGTHHEDITH